MIPSGKALGPGSMHSIRTDAQIKHQWRSERTSIQFFTLGTRLAEHPGSLKLVTEFLSLGALGVTGLAKTAQALVIRAPDRSLNDLRERRLERLRGQGRGRLRKRRIRTLCWVPIARVLRELLVR